MKPEAFRLIAANPLLHRGQRPTVRCAAVDATPEFTEHYAALATYEGLTRDLMVSTYRSVVEDFACLMEGKLRAAHARAPQDDRAVAKLSYLARQARSLVFAR